MNEQEIIDRIKYLIHELGYRQSEFASKADIDPSNLSKYLNGRLSISESLINRLVVNLGVSKRWLTDGTDLPFAKNSTPTTIEAGALQTTGAGTPVYDIDVTAGSMPRSRMWAEDQIVGWVNLPNVLSPDSRIVRVSGDSMAPVINSGDYIAVRELTNIQQIFWGQIYVVLLDDYRVVKYVRRHQDPSMLILRSENKNYDDMEVARSEVRDMMIVQNILHLDTRL